MANDVYKQAIVLAAADSHPNSLTAFQNDSGAVACNFHVLSLATDPSPGYLFRGEHAQHVLPGSRSASERQSQGRCGQVRNSESGNPI